MNQMEKEKLLETLNVDSRQLPSTSTSSSEIIEIGKDERKLVQLKPSRSQKVVRDKNSINDQKQKMKSNKINPETSKSSERGFRRAHFAISEEDLPNIVEPDRNDGTEKIEFREIGLRKTKTAVSVPSNTDANQMLVELFDLATDSNGQLSWQETARWIKYEEDAEGLDQHWGRPHVAFLPLHSLLQLRKCIAKGVILLDVPCISFDDVCQRIAQAMGAHFQMDDTRISVVLDSLKRKHRHVHTDGNSAFLRVATVSAIEHLRSRGHHHNNDEHEYSSDVMSPDPESNSTWHAPPKKSSSNHHVRDFFRKFSAMNLSNSANINHDSNPKDLNAPPKNKSTTSFGNHHLHPESAMTKTHSRQSLHDLQSLMKRLPQSAEVAQVFTGEIPELLSPRFAMIRLFEASQMPELMEAPLPIRFLFVILGPKIHDVDYHELGRSLSALMANPNFHDLAYSARDRDDLLGAVDEFLDDSLVLPPGEIDSERVFSPKEAMRTMRRRKQNARIIPDTKAIQNGNVKNRATKSGGNKPQRRQPLKRTGRLFGGVVDDVRERLPYYFSDYRDALHKQCIASVVFMFCAALAPAVTFGGLMATYTNDSMGIIETLVAQAICGIVWSLTSAQPLLIQSATGPVLIFEASLFTMCQSLGLPFLPIRLWASVYLLVFCILTCAFEAAFLLKYITRFTEDVFSTLISIIFIAEAVKFVIKTLRENPIGGVSQYSILLDQCIRNLIQKNNQSNSDQPFNQSSITNNETLISNQSLSIDNHNQVLVRSDLGQLVGLESVVVGDCLAFDQPDTGILTLMIVACTFGMAFLFRRLRSSVYFGRTMRQLIGDFGVLISILIVSTFDVIAFTDVVLKRVDMPSSFGWTSPIGRGYGLIIDPWLPTHLSWGYAFALVPASLCFILLFVEIQITELILNQPSRGLRKGSGGHHFDLLLSGVLTLFCGIFGLPWMCAAAVQSLAHCQSLCIYKPNAPGQRAQLDYVVEQRITGLIVAILIGLCAFAGAVLRLLPLAVLFGVFLYLGVMNLFGVQFITRLILLFIPEKYFPDTAYCQLVSMWRMHGWTLLQLGCVIVVYLVKYFKQTSIAFPFVLLMLAIIRHFALPYLFTKDEIHLLDGEEENDDDEEENFYDLVTVASTLGHAMD